MFTSLWRLIGPPALGGEDQPRAARTLFTIQLMLLIAASLAVLIASVAAGKTEHIVRRLQAGKAYLFGVTAVNSQGWESDMAQVSVK